MLKLSTVSITMPETFWILVKPVGKIKRNIYIEFYLKRFPWKIWEAEWELGFLVDVLGIVTLNNAPKK